MPFDFPVALLDFRLASPFLGQEPMQINDVHHSDRACLLRREVQSTKHHAVSANFHLWNIAVAQNSLCPA
jgi:hypothetical protein